MMRTPENATHSVPSASVGRLGDENRSHFPLKGERMSDKSHKLHLDPDKVRKVELCHQPPGRERVRVTLEYVSGEVRVLTVHKSLLAALLEDLYAAERQT
jgi:hypothetical protein